MLPPLLWVVFAIINLGLVGCGEGNREGENTKALIIEDEALDPFCSNFEKSAQCNHFRQQGWEMGWEDYFGPMDGFSDETFEGGGGFCGCRRGYSPILYRGLRMCEVNSSIVFQYAKIHIGYDTPGRDQRSVTYIYREGQVSARARQASQGICYLTASMRCKGHNDCLLKDSRGLYVPTLCEAIDGLDYGYCRRANAFPLSAR